MAAPSRFSIRTLLIFVGVGPPVGLATFVAGGAIINRDPSILLSVFYPGLVMLAYAVGLIPALLTGTVAGFIAAADRVRLIPASTLLGAIASALFGIILDSGSGGLGILLVCGTAAGLACGVLAAWQRRLAARRADHVSNSRCLSDSDKNRLDN